MWSKKIPPLSSWQKEVEILYKNADFKRIIRNFGALSIIQMANYIVPLITFPYLVQTLGLEGLGIVTFAQLTIGYFESLLQYSFSITLVNNVVLNAGDKQKLGQIVHNVMGVKLVLIGVSVLILALLVPTIPRFHAIAPMIWLSLFYLVAHVFQLDWFFQGIQEMRNITYLNISGRFVGLIWLFSMVKSPADIYTALLTIPLSGILMGLIALATIYIKYKIPFVWPRWSEIKETLQSGFYVFVSQLLVKLYTADMNMTVLGFISDNATVGLYNVANRVFYILATFASPLTSALYPYLAQLFKTDYEMYKIRTKKILFYLFLGFCVYALAICYFADWIILIVSKTNNPDAVFILQLLSLALVMAPFGPFLSQAIVLHKKDRWLIVLNTIVVGFNAVNLAINYHFFGVFGLATTNIITFAFLIGLYYYVISRYVLLPQQNVA